MSQIVTVFTLFAIMTLTLQIRLQICFSPTNATRSICVGPLIFPQATKEELEWGGCSDSSVCCNWLAWVSSDVKAGGFANHLSNFASRLQKSSLCFYPMYEWDESEGFRKQPIWCTKLWKYTTSSLVQMLKPLSFCGSSTLMWALHHHHPWSSSIWFLPGWIALSCFFI